MQVVCSFERKTGNVAEDVQAGGVVLDSPESLERIVRCRS